MLCYCMCTLKQCQNIGGGNARRSGFKFQVLCCFKCALKAGKINKRGQRKEI